jgi:nucleotide-binding universal stress UspA family protein
MSEADRTIVVGVDYSDHSITAVDEALRSAAAAPGVRLLPVLVLPGGPITGRLKEGAEMTHEVIERSRENLRQLVTTRARSLGLTPPRIEARVRFGSPVEQLLAETAEASAALLVVGTHGRRGLEHLLLGSVAEEVTRQAACSVLVARSGEAGANVLTTSPGAANATATTPPTQAPATVQAATALGTGGERAPREDAEAVVREPHIDAGRVMLHVLDTPTGQVFACAFEDLASVSVEPLEGGWVPAPSSDARARVGRLALRTAAREHATFEELFEEIGRRKAVQQHQR